MKAFIFAKRNFKELLRDPISYIFLLAFPLIMLFIMSAINAGLPDGAQVEIFRIYNLAGGICIFGFSFDMLFAALQISNDRNTSFLTRLYSSPMTPFDFLFGYTIPLIVIAVMQSIITFSVASLPFMSYGYRFNPLYILLSIAVMLPSAILFIAIGMLFGVTLNYKAAPPLSSVIISLSGMLGNIWMSVDNLGEPLVSICKLLPFYHCTESARAAITGSFSDIPLSLLIVSIYAAAIFLIASALFFKNSKNK